MSITVVPDEHILLCSEQTVEVAKVSDLTGETSETISNFIRQHPGTFSDAMAAIMAGVDLAQYR
jgi:hypothetical protein